MHLQTTQRVATRLALVFLMGVLWAAGVLPSLARADERNARNNEGNNEGNNEPSSRRTFSGTWDTMSLVGGPYVLKLDQDGSKVTGKYSPGGGKVEGKIKNGVLRLHWSEDASKGSARFILAPDGQSFSGVANNTDDPDAQDGHWWNGVRHTPASFDGTWNLVSGGTTKYTVLLEQNDNKARGSFTPGNGTIENGKVSGDKLRFKWTQDGGYKGNGRLTLSDDGQSLSGAFNATEGPTKGEVPCVATRAPVSFDGVWTWKDAATGKDFYGDEIYFIQVGNKVNPKEDVGGTIVGNTLFLNWGATGLNHNAILTLDPGGKSFHGLLNWGGDRAKQIQTVGTFIKASGGGK